MVMKFRNLQTTVAMGRNGILAALLSALIPVTAGAQIHASSCTPAFATSCGGTAYTVGPFTLTGATGSISDATSCTGSYQDNSSTMSCTLDAGHTYVASLGGGSSAGVPTGQIWIDFNNNGIFETSEVVGGIPDYNAGPVSVNVTIPPASASIVAGTYRMRVVVSQYVHGSSWGSPTDVYYPLIPPCATAATVTYGQCRDYGVIIATPPVYTVTPTAVTFAPTAPSASSATFNVSFQAAYLTPASGSFTVTAPAGFMVNNGTSWVSSYTIAYSGSTLAATNIPVQFDPTSATTFTGNLTISGGGLSSAVSIPLSGLGATACSGTPTAGAITPAPNYGPSTQWFTLTDAGYTGAGGVGFQWSSCATRSGTYTAIAGANTPIWGFSGLAANTYYVCKVTCGSATVTTDTIEVAYFPPTNCVPYSLESHTDCPSDVVATSSQPLTVTGAVGSISDNASCNGSGYLDRTASLTCSFDTSHSYTISMPAASGLTGQVWIDFNNNGIFETSESVGGSASSAASISITIPSGALVNTGSYRMRVEVSQGGSSESADSALYPNLTPCMWSYSNKHGEARDYRISIISRTATTLSVINTNAPVANEVMIYPNPAQSVLYVQAFSSVNATITSMMGAEVFNGQDVQRIDISNLANGIYIVNVYDAATGLKIKTEKIVKISK